MTAPISQAGPPPVMNRPAVPPRPPQVVYYQPAPPRLMPIQQLLGIALLAGFGLVGVTAGVLRIVKVKKRTGERLVLSSGYLYI